MQSYENLTIELIKGSTLNEKYDNLKGLLELCEKVCYPRRGNPEYDWQLYEVAELMTKFINDPRQ